MRKLIALFFILTVNSIAYAASSVSIIDLISQPEKYDGQEVIVTGFLSLDFEGSGIYLHREDYENSIYKNGLWCDIDVVENKKIDHTYVSLEGIFDAKGKGHRGLWSGRLKDIRRVWSPAKPKKK